MSLGRVAVQLSGNGPRTAVHQQQKQRGTAAAKAASVCARPPVQGEEKAQRSTRSSRGIIELAVPSLFCVAVSVSARCVYLHCAICCLPVLYLGPFVRVSLCRFCFSCPKHPHERFVL